MRFFILPVTIAAILGTAPLAIASETATGSIKAYDLKAMTITFYSDTMYTLPKNFKYPGLKTGERGTAFLEHAERETRRDRREGSQYLSPE